MSDSGDGVTGTTARQGQVLAGHARFLITTAARAPSVHNTQPWRFRTGPDAVEVWGDPRRKLRTDPLGREMLISCGAAVFGLRLAVRSLGYWPVTELLPDPARLRLLARVSIGAAAPATGLERQMLERGPAPAHAPRPVRARPAAPRAAGRPAARRAGRGRHPRAGHRRPGLRPAGADHRRRGPPRRSQPARPGRDTTLDQDRGQHGTRRHPRHRPGQRHRAPPRAAAAARLRPRPRHRPAALWRGIPARHRRVADPRRPPRGLAARRAGAVPDAAARRQPAGLRLPVHPAAGGRRRPRPHRQPARTARPSPDAPPARPRNHYVPHRPAAARRTRWPLTPPAHPPAVSAGAAVTAPARGPLTGQQPPGRRGPGAAGDRPPGSSRQLPGDGGLPRGRQAPHEDGKD